MSSDEMDGPNRIDMQDRHTEMREVSYGLWREKSSAPFGEGLGVCQLCMRPWVAGERSFPFFL